MRRRREIPALPSLLLPLALLGLLGGCSLLLDFEECEVDSDCTSLAEAGEVLVCNGDKYCVRSAEERPECASDAECIVEGEVCVDQHCVEPTTCVNSECAAVGDNMVCGKAGVCVQPLNDNCTRVEGPIANDDIILLGSIMTTSSTSGKPQENAVALAVEEFNRVSPFGGPKRVVLISCTDQGDAAVGVEVARHLVDDVGVQAIVGPGFSSVFIDITTQVTVPAGVFAMSGSATSAAITDLDDNNLAWRASASDAVQSVAIAKRIKDIQSAGAMGNIKVLAYGKDDAYGNGLLGGVNSELAGDDSIALTGVAYPKASPSAKAYEGLDGVPDPDIVLLFGIDEIVTVLDIVEAETTVPPLYIFSDGGKLPQLLERTATNSDLRGRVEGTAPSTENGVNYQGFKFRYKTKYDNEEPVRFSANAYDGAYLVLYAMVALGQQEVPITGTGIADVFTAGTFTTGEVVNAGPDDIQSARNKLSGSTFDFEGASGPLDFDLSTGEAPSNIDRWVIMDDNTFNNCGLYQPGVAAWRDLTPCE